MLCNTTCFTGYYICMPDIIQQRCFTMIYVTHYSNNRRTRLQIFRIINDLFFFHFCSILNTNKLYLKTKLTGDQFNNICLKSLVNGYHDTKAHTFADNISKTHVHQISKLAYRDKLCNLKLVACFRLIY